MQYGLPSERSKAVIEAQEAVLAERLSNVRELHGVDLESDDSGSREARTRTKVVDVSSKNTARRISSVNTTASPSTLEIGALRMMGMDPTTKGGPDAALASAWDPECVFMDKFTLSSAGDAVLKSDLFDE
jgi:hypothetical protein